MRSTIHREIGHWFDPWHTEQMKKLTKGLRGWLRSRQKRNLRKRKNNTVTIVFKGGTANIRSARRTAMPSILSFDTNCSETLKCFHDIRLRLNPRSISKRKTISKHRKGKARMLGAHSPFEEVEHISVSAALVLASEFERWTLKTGIPMTAIDPAKWNRRVVYVLREIGFFDKVDLPLGSPMLIPDLDLQILKMRSGDTADPKAVATLVAELQELSRDIIPQEREDFIHLYGAMIEGVMNVVRHAYPKGASYKHAPIGRWWMAGAVGKSNRQMTIAIYDQGVTIPGSLPAWDRYAAWARNMKERIGLAPNKEDRKFDGMAIVAAVEESVSSTSETHRGLGLAQMRDFIETCSDGFLRINSRCGDVQFFPGAIPIAQTYQYSIGGTLIEWSVTF